MDTQQVLESCLALQQEQNCLFLSTVDEHAEPLASYAPFVEMQHSFYVFVSELALHTQNMLSTKKASVMLIETEKQAKNLYARQRAVMKTEVHLVQEVALVNAVFDKMEAKHGKTIRLLQTLTDFKMLELRPIEGRYIVGFGKAFEYNMKEKCMRHISGN